MKLLAFMLIIGQAIVVHSSPAVAKASAESSNDVGLGLFGQPIIGLGLGSKSAASAEASTRLRREAALPAPTCPKPDYKLIQEKVIHALHQAVEKMINQRMKRAATAKASTEVGPGGKASSSASASANTLGSPLPINPVPVAPVDPVPVGPVDPAPSPVTPVLPVLPVPGTGGSVGSGGTGGSIPILHPAHKHSKIQNVAASANMESGTAIATASRRMRRSDIQNVKASGNKAIASAKNKGVTENGISVQKVEAVGGQLAVATADSGSQAETPALPEPVNPNTPAQAGSPGTQRVKRDDANIQKVKASGNKAIATAQNHKTGATNLQTVEALGGDLAIATAGSGEPAPVLPLGFRRPAAGDGLPGLPGSRRKRGADMTVQNVKASGNKAISKADSHSNGVGTTLQNAESVGNELAVASATHSKRSSACELMTFDDGVKSMISKAVADAFVDLKL